MMRGISQAGGTNVLNEKATEEKGENARLSSFVGALAVTDLLKTTLGPKGQGKLLISLTDVAHFNSVFVLPSR